MAAARNVSAAQSITLALLRLQAIRELADGGGLAGAVHADDEQHARRARSCRCRRRRRAGM